MKIILKTQGLKETIPSEGLFDNIQQNYIATEERCLSQV